MDTGWLGRDRTDPPLDRLGRVAGTASVAVAFVGIATAIALSPSFAFGANALSDLGNPGHPAGTPATALAFNGGLIVGGVLGTAFALAIPEIAGALFVALWVLVHARQSPPIDRRTNAHRTRDR
ncbi:DUF998 domain-containing protein [Halapricum desulfuricans]|uniref:hypothetical protein n=1 Tax=Halapricum desulfuricans TaxID=2841257 RepID=UPI001E2C0AA4|nr:hypothetical protein [Halapricum desulfuricans]